MHSISQLATQRSPSLSGEVGSHTG
eukprot:COSAG06_NODE_52571_length_305_cov_0.504854_1_plen_24_part_01